MVVTPILQFIWTELQRYLGKFDATFTVLLQEAFSWTASQTYVEISFRYTMVKTDIGENHPCFAISQEVRIWMVSHPNTTFIACELICIYGNFEKLLRFGLCCPCRLRNMRVICEQWKGVVGMFE